MIMIVGFSWAQRPSQNQYTVTLNEKSVTPVANFQQTRKQLQTEGLSKAPAQNEHFILQFTTLPNIAEQKQLKAQGINLLSYVHGNAYLVSVSAKFYSIGINEAKNIRALLTIKPEYKIRQDLAIGQAPEYAKAGGDRVKVVITYFKDIDESMIAGEIAGLKISRVKTLGTFHQITAEADYSTINKLAAMDWVQNIEPIDPPSVLENNHGLTLHRANVLSSTIPGLGYGLTGKGVKVGLWDADVFNHRDFNGRAINREFESHTTDHGTHTCGTITGAGLIDPKAKGMAPEATVYAWNFNTQSNGLSVPSERLLALDNDGIEITSNSWGYNVTTCPNPYAYNSTDHNEDLIASWYPYFLYVFSAGNNQSICTGGFNTTSKNMKNSLMVAAIDQMDNMSSFSSFGPSKDGRLIPNISGDGVDTYSTFFDNGYGIMSGTSMATPGVAGTMALVYQRYKETHGGQQPTSAFMRALACNTARDLGAPGPDYKFGYGEINGLHAVEVMEKNNYYTSTVSQGTSFSKNISVPSGALELKVMLAWTDPAGTAGAARILVNDLDLSVSNGSTTTLPWVLDPSNPSANAVRGFDGLNNLEQVTLSNPASGTYTINVDGYEIPEGAQDFAIVYDIVMPSLKLTYPIGGEFLNPGNQEVIRWDCAGYNNSYTLEYSMDGGINFTVIASNISAASRSYLWTVPAGNTNNAKIRISNGSVLNEDKGSFNVMPTPVNLKVASAQCGGNGPFALTWDAVDNASYEVLKLNGQVYEHLADVTSNSYDITGITQNKNNWYTVRAIDLTTGAISQRVYAVTVNPSVSVASLPFSESFESQTAPNFYFTAVKGQGNVRYVNDAQKYGIRLEGTSGVTTDWVNSTSANCFTNNPTYVVSASICNIDASSYAGMPLRLKFDFREKFRTATGTSFFRVKVNGTVLTNTDGTEVYGTANQVSYKTVYYDLSAYAGEPSVSIVFEAVCKTNYTTYVNSSGNYDFSLDTYDVGDFVTIDNVDLSLPVNDLALSSVTFGTGVTAAETITVAVKNLSAVSVSDVPVSYQVNSGAVVNEVVPGPIAPMAVVSRAFDQKADLSVGGLYTLTASVNWPGDVVSANNTLTATKGNNGTDIFIGSVPSLTTCDAWLTDPNGRYADYAISLTKNTYFIPTAGKSIKITFTDFDTEQDYDFVYVYSGTSATAANLLGKFSGSDLPPAITSSAAGGQLYIRFTSDGSENGRGFIAHIECVDKPSVDAAVTAISAPTTSGIKTAAENVTFTVANYGSTALTAYDMYYQLDNNTPVVQSVTADNIAVGSSLAKTFDTKADLSVAGTYALKVWVVAIGDAVTTNDSKTVSITSIASTADAGISALTAIRPYRTALSPIAATIKNFGTASISNFDVAYTINGGAEVVQNFPGTIAAGGTSAITFTALADLTAANSTFNIDVYTKLTGDILATNDKMSTVVVTPLNASTNVVGTYNGTTSLASALAIPAMDLQNNYTFEFWSNLGVPTAFGRIFDKTNVAIFYQGSPRYSTAYPENSYILNVTTPTASFTYYYPGTVVANQWQHLAVTVSSANVYTFYLNGVAQTPVLYTGTVGATKTNATIPLYLGNNAALTRGIKGSIDEVRVWNSCLDQSAIVANMVTDFPANTSGMLAYYKFKEGNGNYLYDYSSNDNTAIVTGADVSGIGDGKFWNTPGFLLSNLSMTGEKIPTTFDASTSTFTAIMDNADLSSLVTNFTAVEKSIVKVGSTEQESGVTSNSFASGPIAYTAEGTGFNAGIMQNYTVKVSNDLSSACDLTAFAFEPANNPGLTSSIVLDANGSNYYKKVTPGTTLSSLKAIFAVSPSAKLFLMGVEQTSPQLTAADYTNPVMVTVVSENGRTFKNYSITVDARSSAAVLTAFEIPGMQVAATIIDNVNHTIKIWVNNSTDVAMLTPAFTVSPMAHVYVNSITQLNGVTTNNFTNPLVYKVVSEDELTSVDWTVTIVNDATSPVITLMGDSPMLVAYGSVFTDPGATALDNVDGDITAKIVITGSVNTAAVGSYTLTYKVTDVAGNITVVTRTVNVTDQAKPVITLNGTSPMTVVRFDPFTDPGATATDNLDGDLTNAIVVTGSVNIDVRGTYTLKYNVQDAAGNHAVEVTRTVNVITLTKPVITLIGSAYITVAQGSGYSDPGATATDKEDGNVTANISVTGNVETATVGTYILTYNVMDSDGNEAVAVIRTVNVTDQTKPVLTLNGTSPMTIAYGSVFTDPGAMATDNVDVNLTAAIVVTGSVDVNTIGSYTLTYTVQDAAGNQADAVTRIVNVVKATAAITISDLSVYYNGTQRSVTVTTVPAGLPVTVTFNGSETVPTEVGVYAVVATINDVNYEGTETASFEILLNTGLALKAGNTVKIYSDGASIYVNIPKLRATAQLTVYNTQGASVYQTSNLAEGLNKIKENIKIGVFVVRVVIEGKTYSEKIVLNR